MWQLGNKHCSLVVTADKAKRPLKRERRGAPVNARPDLKANPMIPSGKNAPET